MNANRAAVELFGDEVDAGAMLVVTGVDIASYGHDLPEAPALGRMLKGLLAMLPELRRLRLSSLDPAAIDADLRDLVANEPRLLPHLHLSIQAGDNPRIVREKLQSYLPLHERSSAEDEEGGGSGERAAA